MVEAKKDPDALSKSALTLLTAASKGPTFAKTSHQEFAGWELTKAGLLTSKSAIYSMSAGANRVEFRNQYTITPAGKTCLKATLTRKTAT